MFPLFPLRLLISLNLALTMNPFSSQFAQPPRPPPPWFPLLPPDPPNSSAFWNNRNVRNQLSELQDTLNIAKAMQKELEMLMMIKEGKGSAEDAKDGSAEASVSEFQKYLEDRRVSLETQESLAVEAANSLMLKLRAQLEPFRYIADETSPWEEKSAPARLENKLRKSKRNKIWRKRKRKRIAEMLAKEREQFDQIDQEANEWMAKEIAKDIANKKVERMKEIAKLKAKEEKKKLESELELLLIVEKLQELRSIRIQKMKRQGYFLPEEDNKFLERVQAAVEEEERQALAAADTDAAREAIVSAEESRKSIQNQGDILKGPSIDDNDLQESKEQKTTGADEKGFVAVDEKESSKKGSDGHGSRGAYDGVTNLPIEFYHYYHGSNSDMGTLIEVNSNYFLSNQILYGFQHRISWLEEDGMLTSDQEEAAYQVTGFSHLLQRMRFGHPTW
ncbi:U11/U12 small nuclear ribonucleoprotein 59 kDa protein isoform X2 [Prosopis cineraria]|uniref:U11/U12 small nuclear ribonucleoprotein 59 kDa protein isoform X2 n=1 Tax=Prosopis cineraria TaxID=364024 RepID=UPI00240EA858|nr:U11/U12 small nuclear ribonucleoprotein 59 kDa protein isoform X2 [Prosopis cineraria]